MSPFGLPDRPRTLTERLARLNDNLQALGERLKASIAGAVGEAIADAVRDALRSLLGGKEGSPGPNHDYRDHHAPDYYRDGEDDPWGEEDRLYEAEVATPTRSPLTPEISKRWRSALGAALQAAVWFLKRQPRRRPVLTALTVTLAAGVTAFVAGPLFAPGAGVLASLAGLMLSSG